MQITIIQYASGLTQYISESKGIYSIRGNSVEFQRDVYDDLVTKSVGDINAWLVNSEVVCAQILDENYLALSSSGERPTWAQF